MRPTRFLPWLVLLALVAWTLWLRWPSLGFRVWNLDEAIHSAVATRLLDGGVLYRDAIDQRTPLTYYAVAGLYRVCGLNNIFALHVFTALVVALTAFLLWQLGRAWRMAGAGAWAAALFATLTTTLLYRGDAYAFNTEWFLALFTTAAALLFACAVERRSNRGLFASGAALGLAFLSKQPALLDAAAPALALGYLAWRQPGERRLFAGRLAVLAAGWFAPVAATALYFAAHGALRDALYYAWSYNVSIYGPEITPLARLGGLLKLGEMFLSSSPALLGWLVAAFAFAAWRIAQRSPRTEEEPENLFLAFLVAWTITSLGGAISGGRGFEHYFIHALPALCLLAGWLLARAGNLMLSAHRRGAARAAAALVLVASAVSVAMPIPAKRQWTLPVDASVRAAEFIRRTTPANEKIFVWGYYPEFYLFAERAPASRFVYASFLTGLVPWTNTAPDRDTTYAIVPGAMDTLLAELESQRPTYFVDTSVGPNRFWQKYPLAKFPALHAFVQAHYLLADPGQFRGQGFDLYVLRDRARRTPLPVQGAVQAPVLDEPRWYGPSTFTGQPATIAIEGRSPNGQLAGLQLLVDGQHFAGVSFAATKEMNLRVPLQFDPHRGAKHQLQVRARAADGTVRDGATVEVTVRDGLLREEELAAFSLPQVTAPLRPLFVQTLYGAGAEISAGRATFFAHAPSTLAFPLPATAIAVQGGFGFRDAAFAPDNKTPTDGAEFRIELVAPDGTRRCLWSRLLRPREVETDRGVQSFRVPIPAVAEQGTRLEFVITPGLTDNAASDWTFWTDLRLETSR